MNSPDDEIGKPRRRDVMSGVIFAVKLVTGVLFIFGLLINFSNVVGRYVFLAPINWAEEIMIFSMVGFVFLGMVVVSWENAHLRMDIVVNLLPKWAKRLVSVITIAAYVGISAIVVYASFEATSRLGRLGRRSVVADIPMVIPHSVVFISFGLALLAVLWRLYRRIGEQKRAIEEDRAEKNGRS